MMKMIRLIGALALLFAVGVSAQVKVSALTELATVPASGDMFIVLDVSATPPATGTTKRISTANLFAYTGTFAGNAATVTASDAAGDTTTFPCLATAATGSLPCSTDAGLSYNATTDALTATTFVGALTGAASGNAVLTANTFTAAQTAQVTDAGTTTVVYPVTVEHQSSNTPAAGLGTGLDFKLEDAGGNVESVATVEAALTDATTASGDADIVFKTMSANAAPAERFRVSDSLYGFGANRAINTSNGFSFLYFGTSFFSIGNGTVSFSNTSVQLGSKPFINTNAPTIASGFGTSPSVSSANGTAAFTVTIGTSTTGITTGTLTMPAATTGWVVNCQNVTNPDTNVVALTGGTTTTAALKNYSRTTGIAADFTASDVLRCTAMAY